MSTHGPTVAGVPTSLHPSLPQLGKNYTFPPGRPIVRNCHMATPTSRHFFLPKQVRRKIRKKWGKDVSRGRRLNSSCDECTNFEANAVRISGCDSAPGPRYSLVSGTITAQSYAYIYKSEQSVMYIWVCASGVSKDCAARGYSLNAPGDSLTGRLRKSILVRWYRSEKKRPVDEGVSASMAECVVINNECFKEQISESFHTFRPPIPPSLCPSLHSPVSLQTGRGVQLPPS